MNLVDGIFLCSSVYVMSFNNKSNYLDSLNFNFVISALSSSLDFVKLVCCRKSYLHGKETETNRPRV